MKIAYFLFLCVAIVGCAAKKEPVNGLSFAERKTQYFRETFIKKFKSCKIPCTFEHKPEYNEYESNATDLNSLDTLIQGSNYTIFFNSMLTDSTNFITLLSYAPTVSVMPVISTYDKLGNKIDEEGIDFGCWDGGPDDYFCTGTLMIDKDYIIFFHHETTVTKCYSCDSTEVYPKKYPYSWRGKISSAGKIDLEERPR